MPRTARPLIVRIVEKLVVSATGCHEWTGGLTRKGYGALYTRVNGRRRLVLIHREFYQTVTGVVLPRKIQVCHSCDNRKCAKFEHLFAGTNADNHKDKARKGRAAKGAMNGNTKLTAADIEQIRYLFDTGHTHVQIGGQFNIHSTTISQIRRKVTWAHL